MSATKLSEGAKPNRMDRRRLKTRALLLAATLDLVVEKGVEKTTMDDITDKADLGRRTLYYHFSSKEECMVAAIAGTYQRHASEVADLLPDSEDPALIAATAAQFVIRGLLREPVTCQLVSQPKLLAAAIAKATEPFTRRDMELGFKRGRFSASIQGPLLESMLLWALVGAVIKMIGSPDDDVDQALQEYAQMYLMMLGIDNNEAKAIAAQATDRLT